MTLHITGSHVGLGEVAEQQTHNVWDTLEGAVTEAAQFDAERRELGPHDMDLEEVRASTRKLVELARHEGVALVIFGHDAEQWPTLKKTLDYYC